MKTRKKMLISVTYETESETKSEINDDEKQLVNYLQELIEDDFHSFFGTMRIKRIVL